jgi:hypothetical protein
MLPGQKNASWLVRGEMGQQAKTGNPAYETEKDSPYTRLS